MSKVERSQISRLTYLSCQTGSPRPAQSPQTLTDTPPDSDRFAVLHGSRAWHQFRSRALCYQPGQARAQNHSRGCNP